MKKIKYSVTYHKLMKKYILWKEVENEHGWGEIGIYAGTRKDCYTKLKELKNIKN